MVTNDHDHDYDGNTNSHGHDDDHNDDHDNNDATTTTTTATTTVTTTATTVTTATTTTTTTARFDWRPSQGGLLYDCSQRSGEYRGHGLGPTRQSQPNKSWLHPHPASRHGSSGRARFFQYLGACRRRTPKTRADLKVPKDASHRDLSHSTPRFDLALGVRRRHAPESC